MAPRDLQEHKQKKKKTLQTNLQTKKHILKSSSAD